MGLMADTIVLASRRVCDYAEKLLVGIQPAQFARQPLADGKLIETNHPAWIYGHLSLYPARALLMLNRDAQDIAAPAEWSKLFDGESTCQDDPAGRIYPTKDVLTAAFFKAFDGALGVLKDCDDELFARPTPHERLRPILPTVATAVLGMMSGHMMFHFGQLSTWRRCMGLGPAM